MEKEQREALTLSVEEREALEAARKMPICFDEDCPETTPKRAVRFKRVNPRRGSKRAEVENEFLCAEVASKRCGE